MNKPALTAAFGAACLALAACGDREARETNAAAADGAEAAGVADSSAADANAGSAAWPAEARIVEEGGVTYRVDPDGTRVRLGPTDARIVVEDGDRFRVDPDGTRVRIDDEGAVIDLPDVDVGVNEKGNLDVDVGDRDPDGGR